MDIQTQIAREIQESIDIKLSLLGASLVGITAAATRLCDAIQSGNKLLIFGNGGSAADAQHIAAELVGRYRRDRKAIPALALTVDSSAITSVANDYGYDAIFARQIQALGSPNDVALAISTSGNSVNVLRGVEAARDAGLFTIGLSGKTGGKLATVADLCICMPTEVTPRIQEAHILIAHIWCGIVEQSVLAEHSHDHSGIHAAAQGTTSR